MNTTAPAERHAGIASPSKPSMKALITGHSRGLGSAIATNLLRQGIPVLGVARSRSSTLAQQFGMLFEEAALDLADIEAVLQWLEEGRLRQFFADSDTALLINNAGVLQPVGTLATQEPSAVARAVSVNVAIPMLLSSAVTSLDIKEKRILHVSSGAGRNAYPGWSVYCATKAALDHHARAAALDNVPGLRICSLAPGVIDTDMQAQIRATPLERFPLRERFEELKRSGNLATPEETATRLVGYLLSERFGKAPVADLRDEF